MSFAKPKPVFVGASVPPIADGPSVRLISHPSGQLWFRHKSDEPYFTVWADTTPKDVDAFFMDLQICCYHSHSPPDKPAMSAKDKTLTMPDHCNRA